MEGLDLKRIIPVNDNLDNILKETRQFSRQHLKLIGKLSREVNEHLRNGIFAEISLKVIGILQQAPRLKSEITVYRWTDQKYSGRYRHEGFLCGTPLLKDVIASSSDGLSVLLAFTFPAGTRCLDIVPNEKICLLLFDTHLFLCSGESPW